jgi:hypothetical protein
MPEGLYDKSRISILGPAMITNSMERNFIGIRRQKFND